MSLINQALKLEQQRRQTAAGPLPPMATRLAAQHHRRGDRMPLLLIGFTGMGMLLAVSVTAILYFGSEYVGSEGKAVAAAPVVEQAPVAKTDAEETDAENNEIDSLLGALSSEQIATVQQMLLQKQTESATTQQAAEPTAPADNAALLAQKAQMQEMVDGFSVQGIRKAGAATRVFLNGKIQRLGDVLDIETGLVLIGFNDHALVFEDANGFRYEKSL